VTGAFSLECPVKLEAAQQEILNLNVLKTLPTLKFAGTHPLRKPFPICFRRDCSLERLGSLYVTNKVLSDPYRWSDSVRVLIIEDDPFIALDLQAIVEGEGHEVVGSFESLAEAQEHLEDGFDYALLDIDVVGGKTFGIAAELRERRIPFAFVSASRPAEVPHDLRHASFISKPFEERAVLKTIAQAVHGRLVAH